MKSRIFFLLMGMHGTCLAGVEVWECTEFYQSKVLVAATVDEGRLTGSVSVAGVTYKASFGVKGFDRRWDFELRDDFTYQYAFKITPDGRGAYYDFSLKDTAGPTYIMSCKQKK